jgi:hydrogenase expression/formation protein HypC
MCLGIPGRVVELYLEHEVLMGKVDFGGVTKGVCLSCVPEVRLGDYVVVHVGFGLSVVDEQEAQQSFAFLEAMNELGEVARIPSSSGRCFFPVAISALWQCMARSTIWPSEAQYRSTSPWPSFWRKGWRSRRSPV